MSCGLKRRAGEDGESGGDETGLWDRKEPKGLALGCRDSGTRELVEKFFAGRRERKFALRQGFSDAVFRGFFR